MAKNIMVYTTAENNKSAEKLARGIIDNKLGACVQISEVKSVYNWKGKQECSKEIKLSIKTTNKKYEELQNFIIKNSKYELPEIVSVDIKGYKKYLNWIKGVL
ncbi:MAG: divalent-cation tolerance protein CutA [Nanoarchaeota archaeon]